MKVDKKYAFHLIVIFLIGLSVIGCKNTVSTHQVPTPQLTDQISKVRVRGTIRSRSDVQTIQDKPLSNVTVLAVSTSTFDLFLDQLFSEDISPHTTAILGSRQVPPDLYEKYVADATVSDKNGQYVLQLIPNSYYFCLANITVSKTEETSPRINGCSEVEVTNRGTVNQDIYWGMGGVQVP